jgi:transposase
MLTVDEYGRIRRAHRDGMSIREMRRRFGYSRNTIRKALRGEGEPAAYRKRRRQVTPKLGPLHEVIRQILREDESAPPKQRHTMMQVFERLCQEHGYTGGYDAVRRFIRKERQGSQFGAAETFIPLDHEPGQRIEADFGEIAVDFPEGRRKVSVLILVWSHSNAPFAIALPTQRTEAILEGMTQAFEFFGCVPREVWWDNPRTVAAALLVGRERRLNERYAALASHFAFEPLFCLPARGNEKPVVENRVKTLQRKWSTPVPQVQDLDELNTYLRTCCVKERDRTSSGKAQTIGRRFEQDQAQAGELPRHRFDPCVRQAAKVDKYQFARFDKVSYSVPRHCAFQSVTVKGYVDRVEIVRQDAVVAVHPRSYEPGEQVLDPLHYLTTLARRPAALDHSNVYRRWKLPQPFAQLRERLENRHGTRAGVRQYVRVLQLLASHPIERVEQAIEQLRGPEGADAERIIRRVERSAEYALRDHTESSQTMPSQRLSHDELSRPEVLSVQVPCPSLSHFDRFLDRSVSSLEPGGDGNGCQDQPDERRPEPDAAAGQPQAASAADDVRGVREAGPRGGGVEPDVRAVPLAADRAGGGGAGGQRPGLADQAGPVPGGEGPGELRLLGHRFGQQAEGPGTGPLRVDSRAGQPLSGRSAWHRQDAPGGGVGPGRLP